MLENLNSYPCGVNEIKLKVLLEARKEICIENRIKTLFPPVEIGSITLVDQIVLLSLLQISRPKVIIEIGTYLGFTTSILAMNAEDSIIYTIDLPEGDSILDKEFSLDKIRQSDSDNDNYLRKKQSIDGEIYIKELDPIERDRIQLVKCNSTQIDFSKAFAKADFVFIDGGHDLETVEKDTLNARDIVKKGVIVWHDYGSNIHGDVTKFLNLEKGRRIFHVSGSLCAFELIGF